MRLSKLTISGFKSFADKTTLHFDHGITCIVGPNGCGKSNISDAFRWVLGEQSVKSLRGGKMQDVIFSGTSNRKPLNIAEVSLTLTDIQGSIPLDYEEVTITRRLHRSGESEYLINNNQVRLKDLQSLFLDSGVGRNAFSIFEQGKLDQVISFTPYERRYIFEEAAGILRFLQRKKESLKRVEDVDLNLSRLQDIYKEIEQQIGTLEKQAKKAIEFKGFQKELEQIEKVCCILRWNGLKKKCVDLSNKQKHLEIRLDEIKEEGLKKEESAREKKIRWEVNEQDLRKQNEKILKVRGQFELENRESEVQQQQQAEAQLKIKKLKQEQEDLFLSKKTNESTLIELQRKKEQLEKNWKEIESGLENQKERVKEQETAVFSLRTQLAHLHKKHVSIIQNHGEVHSQIKQTEVRLENQIERQKQLERKKIQLSVDEELALKVISEKRELLGKISSVVDGYKERLDQFEDDLRRGSKEIEQLKIQHEAIRKKIMGSTARLEMLLKLREEHEGFSSGAQQLLKESKNKESCFYNILKPFYEFFEAGKENRELLAITLRNYAQTLVIERKEDFEKVIAFAKAQNLHDFSLLCIEWLNHKNFSRDGSAITFTDHFLSSIAETVSYQESLSLWMSEKCVEGFSSEGLFVDFRGVLFDVKLADNQVFMRESEIKLLTEEVTKEENERLLIERSIQQLEQIHSQLKLERAEVDKLLRRDEMKLVEVNFGLQRSIGDQEKYGKDRKQLQDDEAKLTNDSGDLHGYKKTLDERFQLLEKDLNESKKEEETLERNLMEQEGILRLYLQDQKEKGSSYQEAITLRQQITHEYHLIETKQQGADAQGERIEGEIEEWSEKQALFYENHVKSKVRLQEIEKLLKEANETYQELEKGTKAIRADFEEVTSAFEDYQKQLKQVEQDYLIIQMQLEQQQVACDLMEHEGYEKYHQSLEKMISQIEIHGISLEKAERKSKEIRQLIDGAGNVNLAAIEELEMQQERGTVFGQQINDLVVSKKELESVIEELEDESRKIFQTTFDQIRSNFKKNFQILFNGGEADLELTDSGDILRAGIEITAKPPGKQMRSMTLLSGGEKCLTAVALMFSIFEVRPAPFCILDEIDAPLDDTNVERFVNVVKHFVDKCQFLIITHNKRTMAIGDILFGVSMEDKGVSKLISLEFAREVVPEPALL